VPIITMIKPGNRRSGSSPTALFFQRIKAIAHLDHGLTQAFIVGAKELILGFEFGIEFLDRFDRNRFKAAHRQAEVALIVAVHPLRKYALRFLFDEADLFAFGLEVGLPHRQAARNT
jgi:hypothetical protein